jgi:hypothetical protein
VYIPFIRSYLMMGAKYAGNSAPENRQPNSRKAHSWADAQAKRQAST